MTAEQQTQIREYLTFSLAKKTKLPALTTGSFFIIEHWLPARQSHPAVLQPV